MDATLVNGRPALTTRQRQSNARTLNVEALNHPGNAETEVLAAWVDAALEPGDPDLVSSSVLR